MSLTGRPVTPKNQKQERTPKESITPHAALIALARAKGTERQYLDWLRTQPSALGTGWDYDWEVGNFCLPVHWRTARHAGVATKPMYMAIPLRDAEPRLAHQKGDSVVGDRNWWQRQCVWHLGRCVEVRTCEDSWR